MVDANEIKQQLQHIGADFKFWGRAELRELPRILFQGEQVEHVINGRYTGGFAMLVGTDQRVLLIDKKPLYLTLEDIRYDMISDVMFNHRLLDASVNLGTMHKDITFVAYNPAKLRAMVSYIQQKVMEFRRMHDVQQAAVSPAAASNLQADVVSNMVVPPSLSPMNPYKSPVMIRRRVSRFN
jgi:hypothetical protein